MKTRTKVLSGMAVIALALTTVATVSADTLDPSAVGGGYGRGTDGEQGGLLADYMEAAIAEELGLTVEALNALEAGGATHYAIALELGFSVEEFYTMLASAREHALALAAQHGIAPQRFGQSRNAGTPGQFGAGLRNGHGCDDQACVMQPPDGRMIRGGGRR